MRRHTLSTIVALALMGAGILSMFRGQWMIGIAFVAIAILRLGTVVWGQRQSPPKPSIRLNLDDQTPEAGPPDTASRP